MSVNSITKAALDTFGDPVAFGEYVEEHPENPAARYYSFNYTIVGVDYGDDAPSHQKYLMQVHFFCPRTYDSVQRILATQQALYAADFTWPEVVIASDENGQHIIFECECVEGVALNG